VRRWREAQSLPDEADGEASMTPELLRVPSVEQQLINCQEREDMESILDKKSKAKIEKRLQTSLYIVCTALSRRDASKYLGITREAVRQRVHREEKQLKGNYLAPANGR
jgi:DNA-directed RNA polymerase specialized sigma24 family protein